MSAVAEGQVAPESAEAEPPADTARIHNFDQRAAVVELRHPALPKPLQLEQRGATSAGFVPGTSSVAWPVAQRMAYYLCESPALVRGRRVVELGAGLGLVGAAAAALGAAHAVLTDCEEALPLLERNRRRLAEDGVAVHVARLHWGCAADHEALLGGTAKADAAEPSAFDVVLASDVVVAGFDTAALFASCKALLARSSSGLLLLGFEFREDWETIGTFIERAEAAGLSCSHVALDANGRVLPPRADEDEDEEDAGDMLLYTFRWQDSAGTAGPSPSEPAS